MVLSLGTTLVASYIEKAAQRLKEQTDLPLGIKMANYTEKTGLLLNLKMDQNTGFKMIVYTEKTGRLRNLKTGLTFGTLTARIIE
jgi:hypothetical protein